MNGTLSPEPPRRQRPGTLWFFFGITLLVGCIVGFYVATQTTNVGPPLRALQRLTQLAPNGQRVYDEILQDIQSSYVKQPVDEQKLFYGAMTGLVRSLGDPYSTFLTPEGARAFQNDLDLSIEGIGAEIGFKDEQLAIIAPLPNSPAERAGLKAGDLILLVNDEDLSGLTIDDAVQRIRGKAGTKAVIVIRRGKEKKTYTVTREKITISSVTSKRLSKGIAYIQVVSFNEDTATKFDAVVRGLLLDPPKGIILDLRNNPGGLLDSAIELTSEFIGKGVVLRERNAKGEERIDTGARDARVPDTPLVVLVNGGSASASEIMAGALQDAKRARVLGSKTFGKGSVQTLNDLPDGSQLKLTIAKWFTPNGRSIDGEGIAPDILVPDPTEAGEAKDGQLQRALELLTKL